MSYNVILTNDGGTEGFNMLREKGFKTFHFPMIKTSIQNQKTPVFLNEYDFVIFMSKNGIKYFFENEYIKDQKLSNIKALCIGSKTAQVLGDYNIDPVFISKRSYSEKMFEELKKSKIIDSKKVILVQGTLSKNYLFENLEKICYLTKFVSYKTEPVRVMDEKLKAILDNKKTYTVFTSPSGFQSFERLYEVNKTSIISIGETTSSYIKKMGYDPLFTSKMQSFEGISESIISNIHIN